MSRWDHWSNSHKLGFSSFLAEATKPQTIIPTQDPAAYAAQQGWTPAPFGYYKDGSGKVVARSIEGQLVAYDNAGGQPQEAGGAPIPLDTGNPAVTAGQTPADRARSMGLQSDGRGSYLDQAGNVVARTVNNELVFYDSNGGAVADGGGGMALTQAQPSWVDDVTGLIVVPPAQPETPKEIAEVPDPVPASMPVGYSKFMQQRKLEKHAQAKEEQRRATEEQQREEAFEEHYSSSESMSTLRSLMQPKIDAAIESCDERRMQIGQFVKEKMMEHGEEFAQIFQDLDPEQHEEAIQELMKFFIVESKGRWSKENIMDPLENSQEYKDMDEEDQLKAYLIATQDPGYNSGGSAGKANVIRMLEKQNELVAKRSEEQEMKQYEGDRVTYTLKNPDDRDMNKNKLIAQARKTLKKYDLKPGGLREVVWNVNNEEETDPQEKIKTAMDALRVWRAQVLPDLEPGTIVTNTPSEGGRGNNQRERIYQLAGLGGFDEKLGTQSGVVVDEDGEKKVVPIDGKTRSKKLKESLMRTLFTVNESEATLILEGYINENV